LYATGRRLTASRPPEMLEFARRWCSSHRQVVVAVRHSAHRCEWEHATHVCPASHGIVVRKGVKFTDHSHDVRASQARDHLRKLDVCDPCTLLSVDGSTFISLMQCMEHATPHSNNATRSALRNDALEMLPRRHVHTVKCWMYL
jgi:hypothetical protein